ncbi:hypothetical protein PAXRUDRAFT_133965 [Paxillus rubicundulus Ve08.2h10]|uniref:Uncharacterized protein n=1 Tax=Paxillus rubicundulus Ve08.2h10 TaxID=930991 RepID=A0A0D0EC10_9AGAM|nr:hypothetical protein PAXRUDRAFT_133965 [Paxillus rubicundulus Ve08.2h10]
MADPALKVYPNFASEAFAPIREALIQATNESAQQVTECLIAAWDAEHNIRVAEEAEQQQREQEEEELHLAKEEAEQEHREGEKKKPKMNNFDQATSVSSVIVPCPSQYALQRLNNFNHVDLWYLSPASCAKASKYNRSNADVTFGISKVDDILMLRSVTVVKASRNSVEDHDLSFEAFLQVKNNLLFYAKKASWPGKHLDALAEFFWNVETHPMCSNPNGNTTVLTYALRVHHSWHNDLKANKVFNIAIISDELMKNIDWEINAKASKECAHKASVHKHVPIHHTNFPFPSPPYCPIPPLALHPFSFFLCIMVLSLTRPTPALNPS